MIYNSEIYAQIMNQSVNCKPKIIVRKTGKKLVLKKAKVRSRSFRLLTFHSYDDNMENVEEKERIAGAAWTPPEKEFTIQMFGINEKGETATIFVKKFTPFFYVKVCIVNFFFCK